MKSSPTSLSNYLVLVVFIGCTRIVTSTKNGYSGHIGCQHKSTSGRTYVGEANTTVDGIPCQNWTDTHPHKHGYTHVGDHNFCRNPTGANFQHQMWCFSTDPGHRRQNCSVAFCPFLKAIEFSTDFDEKYEYAFIRKESLPSSFTVCIAFMVEAWTRGFEKPLFGFLDDKEEYWLSLVILSYNNYTQFLFQLEDSPMFATNSDHLHYPLQWSRVCLSMDSNSNSSAVRLVVDGEQLMKRVCEMNEKPDYLGLVLGFRIARYTYVNIFSSALPAEQMKRKTSPGEKECELVGDIISWAKSVEEKEWTLSSKARGVDLDSELEGPCRLLPKMNIFPMIEEHSHSDCMMHCKKFGGQSPPVTTQEEWEDW